MMDTNELHNRFDYHPPKGQGTINAHADMRNMCKNVADVLNQMLPDGREKSLAITHLEEVMMWSNAAIARHGGINNE